GIMKAIRVLLSILLAVAAIGTSLAIRTSLVRRPAEPPGGLVVNTPLASPATPASSLAVPEMTRGQGIATHGKLPLSFVANQGQTSQPVKFMSQTTSYGLYVTSTEAVLTLRRPAREHRENGERRLGHRPVVSRSSAVGLHSPAEEPTRAVLHLTLVGANA